MFEHIDKEMDDTGINRKMRLFPELLDDKCIANSNEDIQISSTAHWQQKISPDAQLQTLPVQLTAGMKHGNSI